MLSRELYEEIKESKEFDFSYLHKGLLMYYQTEKAGAEEWKVGQRAIKEGLKVEHLSKEEVQKIEKNIDLNIKGAVYYHSDAHMTPNEFMPQLKAYLEKKGVAFFANEEVKSIDINEDKVLSVSTNNQILKADEFVIAAGSWSQNFAKKLNVDTPIQAGKGYSINLKKETNITIPAILIEPKVAVTLMNGFIRLAGTMEIGGINHKINPVRVNSIAIATENYYPNVKVNQQEKEHAKYGLRPCSPDGLPYIGKSRKCKNVTFATVHAMMGQSLGPATGKLVSEIISDKKTALNLSPFSVDRKF